MNKYLCIGVREPDTTVVLTSHYVNQRKTGNKAAVSQEAIKNRLTMYSVVTSLLVIPSEFKNYMGNRSFSAF